MKARDIIVVGASAGGVSALRELISGLARDLPASVFVVLHVPQDGTSSLPEILSRAGSLPAVHPRDGDPIENGRVYVAPPDRHLLITGRGVRLSRGPRENRHRPAIDPLFRSAAQTFGARVVGVILTGSLDDGAAGLAAIKQRGGVAIVQDPDEAEHPSMPRAALASAPVDHIVPVAAMPALLTELASTPVLVASAASEEEPDDHALQANMEPDPIGTPSAFACPECNGVLWEIDDKGPLRFRCRIGHGYAAESLIVQQEESLENSLWAAVRALEETAELQRRVAARLRRAAADRPAERMERRAGQALRQAETIRELLERADPAESAESVAASEVRRTQRRP